MPGRHYLDERCHYFYCNKTHLEEHAHSPPHLCEVAPQGAGIQVSLRPNKTKKPPVLPGGEVLPQVSISIDQMILATILSSSRDRRWVFCFSFFLASASPRDGPIRGPSIGGGFRFCFTPKQPSGCGLRGGFLFFSFFLNFLCKLFISIILVKAAYSLALSGYILKPYRFGITQVLRDSNQVSLCQQSKIYAFLLDKPF